MSGFVKLKKSLNCYKGKNQHEAEASIPSSEIEGKGRGGGYITHGKLCTEGFSLNLPEKSTSLLSLARKTKLKSPSAMLINKTSPSQRKEGGLCLHSFTVLESKLWRLWMRKEWGL